MPIEPIAFLHCDSALRAVFQVQIAPDSYLISFPYPLGQRTFSGRCESLDSITSVAVNEDTVSLSLAPKGNYPPLITTPVISLHAGFPLNKVMTG